MAILTIDGAAMPSPSEMIVDYKDVGKAETAASGETVMDRIAVKRTVTAVYNYLTPENAALLLQAVKSALFFTLEFHNPMSRETVTGTFRSTTCTVSPMRYEAGQPVGYTGGRIVMEER